MKIIIIEQVCPLDASTVMQQMHMMTRPEPFTDTVCYLVARELVVTTCLPGKNQKKKKVIKKMTRLVGRHLVHPPTV